MGDIYGRVRIYNLGFAVFTFFSLLLTHHVDDRPRRRRLAHHHAHLPGRRGGHAHGQLGGHPDRRLPDNQRGMALGVNQAAAFSGTFIGLVLGGVLAPINWRSSSWSRCPSACSGPCSATSSSTRRARGGPPASTGRATSPSPSAWSWSWSASPTASSPTATTHGVDESRWCSGRSPLGVVLLGAFCVIETQVARAHVPAPAVQDPGLHHRRARQLPGRAQPGRSDVHAHHLAPGDLAAPSRLRLRP